MLRAVDYPMNFGTTPSYRRDAAVILSADEEELLVRFLSENPAIGDIIPGTAGVRLMKWRALSQGDKAYCQIYYYFRDLNMPLYLLAVYPARERLHLIMREHRAMEEAVEQIIELHSQLWRDIVEGLAS